MADSPAGTRAPHQLETLTRREREVLSLIGQGYTLPEIAERLYRSHKTIESHRLALGRKLGAGNRVELARIAITAGLAPLHAPAAGPREAEPGELRRDLADHRQAWEALRAIDAAVSAATGFTYFRRLVTRLTRGLGVRCALVGELAPEPALPMRNLLLAERDDLREWEPTSLKGTPCEVAVQRGHARFDDVPARFPDVQLLAHFEVQSYVGIRLSSAEGDPLGVLALLHDGPLDESRQPEAVLRICASRAAAELERTHMEEQLRVMSESLERTIEQRTRALREANDLLKRRLDELTRAQGRLRVSEGRFRTLVETMSDGIAVIDASGRLTYVNERFAHMLGREVEDLLGREPAAFMPPAAAEAFRAKQRDREADRLSQYEIEFRHADGSIVRTLVAPRSLYDENERYAGSFGVITDITHRSL